MALQFCGLGFCQEIKQNLDPLPGHLLIVEKLDAVWDFHPWLQRLGVSLSGIAILGDGLPVAHSFRLVRRQDLAEYSGAHQWKIDKDKCKKTAGLLCLALLGCDTLPRSLGFPFIDPD